ncbi:hypothetical protein HDU96_006684 [Phlyctochytrium bullatum]|nr:hypothetical protein HDU96_006684 [Phlyctochytrium bullatum]
MSHPLPVPPASPAASPTPPPRTDSVLTFNSSDALPEVIVLADGTLTTAAPVAEPERHARFSPLPPGVSALSGDRERSLSPSGGTRTRRLSFGRKRTLQRQESTATDLLDDLKHMKVLKKEKSEMQKGTNTSDDKFSITGALRFTGSVLPTIVIPGVLTTLWALLWCVLYMHTDWRFWVMSPHLIAIMSVVLGLLLVFRTNTAYDRYWEGRKFWAAVTTHCRNTARLIWISGNWRDEKDAKEARGVLNLVLAWPIAMKHLLREETGAQYPDLAHLLIHVPELNPVTHPDLTHIPIRISYQIAAYVAKARKLEIIDMQTQVALIASLSGLIDCQTSFERIQNTPIPRAYSIHLKQVVLLYLLSLPFQLVSALYYATVPVVAIASFTFFGIESIAGQIENPFGYDPNDLTIDEFIAQIRDEIHTLVSSKARESNPDTWTKNLHVYSEMSETLEETVPSPHATLRYRRPAQKR